MGLLRDNENTMSLSAHTDDNTGKPLGDGFIRLSTSAGNSMVFADPASANSYLLTHGSQFNKAAAGNNSPDGDFNDQSQSPA